VEDGSYNIIDWLSGHHDVPPLKGLKF
jgi:hypothetical protein